MSLAALFKQHTIVDLTHKLPKEKRPLGDRMPYSYPYNRMMVTREPKDGRGYTLHLLLISEHMGTHMDSPAHFSARAGKHYIHKLPLQQCMGQACVIDFSKKAVDLKVMPKAIKAWEKKHGEINKDDIVLVRYTSSAKPGKWPGLGIEAARYLTKKKIKLFGATTGTIDHCGLYFTNKDKTLRRVYGTYLEAAHVELLSHKVLIMENLTNLDKLPPKGAFYMGLPLNIEEGTGSPLRAVAFVPKKH